MDSTLVSSTIRPLALKTVQDVEALILSHSSSQYDGLLDLVDKVTEHIRETVSREVAQKLVAHCSQLSHYAGFLISISLSSILDTISTEYVDNRGLATSFPIDFLSKAASRLSEGLSSLNVSGAYVGDEFLVALSTSGAAKTLRKFSARHSFISDTSSHSWSSFPVLEEIEINATDFFGEKTLLAISRLPEIRVLYAYTSDPFNPELLHVLLAPGNMPKLSIFDVNMQFDDSGRELDILLDVLDKRPDRQLIESIHINLNWMMDDRLKRLHRLCPNLTKLHGDCDEPFSADRDAELLSCLSNLRDLNVSVYFESPTAALVTSKLPVLFPSLENLIYRDAEPIDDFSMFTNLKDLCYFPKKLENIRLLPRNLETLMIGSASFHDDDDEDDDAVAANLPSNGDKNVMESLISNIVNQLPKLKSLQLKTSKDGMITKQNAEFLLEKLVELTSMRLHCGQWEESAVQPFVVSHPNLLELPRFFNVEDLQPAPGRMQSLESVWVSTIEQAKVWSEANMNHLPSLRSVNWSADDDPKVSEEFFRSLIGSRISELSTSVKVDSALIQILPQLHYLHSLDLREEISVEAARALFQSLRWLSIAEFVVSGTANEFGTLDWIDNPRLFRLSLSMNSSSDESETDATAAEPKKEFNPTLTSERLPSIQRISLIFHEWSSSACNLNVENLPRLTELNVTVTSNETAVGLSISGCPFISGLVIDGGIFNSIKLRDAPFLRSFEWRSSKIGEHFGEKDLDLDSHFPNLKTGTVFIQEEDNKEPLSAVVEKFKSRSPQNAQWRVDIVLAATESVEHSEDYEDDVQIEGADEEEEKEALEEP